MPYLVIKAGDVVVLTTSLVHFSASSLLDAKIEEATTPFDPEVITMEYRDQFGQLSREQVLREMGAAWANA